MTSIKRLNLQKVETDIETARIHIETARVRSWSAEWVDSTHSTKAMLCGSRVKSIGGQKRLARQKLKIFWRDDETDEALFGTDGTVASERFAAIQANPKPDATAMTTTLQPFSSGAINHLVLMAALSGKPQYTETARRSGFEGYS